MVCENDFAVQDGKLRVHLISTRSTVKKSDSFIVEYGGEYLLMNGGVKDFNRTLARLRDCLISAPRCSRGILRFSATRVASYA